MKIGNLYNLDSFQKFLDSGKMPGFADSYAGTVLARNLTAVDPRVFEKKYPELSFVNSGIEANNTGGYAQRIQSLRLLEQGAFKTAGDASGNKGKISLTAEDSFLKVIEREAESDWTDTKVKQAELQGINLVSDYISSHNKIYLREVDEIGYVGIDSKTGLLNHAGFTSSAASDTVENLSAQGMYDEIAGLITDQHNGVYNTMEYMANRVDMPVTVYNKYASTMLNTANGSSTVLKALQDNYPGVTFNATFRAESVGESSVTAAYCNNSEAMVMRIPEALTIGEIVKRGSFDFHVDSKYRIAGLDVLENTAGRLLTGL
jgi:hypothetical protein